MHNMFLVIIIVALILVYSAFSGGGGAPAGNHPNVIATPDARQANPAAAVPGQIDTVRKRENGDSAFATDLYASMSDPERAYYSMMFYSVMTNVADNTPYVWQNVNTAGSITPLRTFVTSEDITCRDFKETLKVHMIEQSLTGIACPQADGSWCKLKPNATPSCGLGGKHGGILDAIKGLF